MIVLSGILVVAAAVLLAVGLITSSLALIYISIAVSVLSGVFLIVGVLQRRGDEDDAPSGQAAAPAQGGRREETRTDVEDRGERQAPEDDDYADEYDEYDDEGEDLEDEEYDEYEDTAGYVFIVPGRPRYHAEGCRYLVGKDVEELPVEDAQDEAYTSCGVCRPDELLAAAAAAEEEDVEDEYEEDGAVEEDGTYAEGHARLREAETEFVQASAPAAVAEEDVEDDDEAEYDDDEYYEDDEYDDDEDDEEYDEDDEEAPAAETELVEAEPEPEPDREQERAARRRRAREAAAAIAPVTPPSRLAEPAGAERAPRRGGAAAGGGRATSTRTGGRAASGRTSSGGGGSAQATTSRSSSRAAAKPAEPAARGTARNTVVAIPDRDKYHQASCRYVRDNSDAYELNRQTAKRRGYEPCGVCKP